MLLFDFSERANFLHVYTPLNFFIQSVSPCNDLLKMRTIFFSFPLQQKKLIVWWDSSTVQGISGYEPWK